MPPRARDEGQNRAGRVPEPTLRYRLCPECARAVPTQSGELYCINDGTRLLEDCPGCGASITSPYSRYCSGCGRALSR